MAFLTTTNSELVDDLCTSVINSCRLPVSQNTFTPAIIAGFMNEEQTIKIVPLVNKVREDYWLFNYDQTILANVYTYPMPPRCTAGALRNVVFVDPSGYEIDVPHLDPDQIKTPSYFSFRPSWQGQGFFLQNDQVVFWPQTFTYTSFKLRQKYLRRPNQLTLAANCSQISSLSVGSQTITFVAACPFTNGQVVDVIATTGQFSSQIDGLLIASGGGTTTITIDSSTPFTASVTTNSYVCPTGLTCIPQIPLEGYPLYVARSVARIAAAMSNSNLFNVAEKMAEDALAELTTVLTPRVAGSPRKLVNKNVVGGPYSFPYYR